VHAGRGLPRLHLLRTRHLGAVPHGERGGGAGCVRLHLARYCALRPLDVRLRARASGTLAPAAQVFPRRSAGRCPPLTGERATIFSLLFVRVVDPDPDPHHFADVKPKCMEYEPILALFSRVWFFFKLVSGSGSASAHCDADPQHCFLVRKLNSLTFW
jgi:hypothetical protein